MSDDNVYDLFGSADDEEAEGSDNTEDLNSFEDTDPATIAFLDQQSAEFNAHAEHEFADRYGFVHKCRCDQDYSSGNLVEVTECYANMTLEALDACATLHAENKMLRTLIKQAIGGQIASTLAGTDATDGPETD